MTAESAYSILDTLIEQDKSFAIYRLPGESVPQFVMQTSGTPVCFDDIERLNGKTGFVIAPFYPRKEVPILLIAPDCTDLSEITPNTVSVSTHNDSHGSTDRTLDKAAYEQLFVRFHEPLLHGEFEKLVLSRSKKVNRKADFSPGLSFFYAAEKYRYSYVYLFHTPQSGTWLGSTPEILLAGKEKNWKTIALAGTRFPNSEIVTWDDKNLNEQRMVSDYLSRQLSAFHITPERKGPYTVKAGELAHLRTDFSFTLPQTNDLGSLLKSLHPTPAISGLPKDKAYRFIRENETHDRLYYSGFLGLLNPESETNLYVNLRCMHIEKSSLTLFAGGGLLASSSLEEEWEETEYKLRTMFGILK